MFELNLICPDCGGYHWQNLDGLVFECADCGAHYTPGEMEYQAFDD